MNKIVSFLVILVFLVSCSATTPEIPKPSADIRLEIQNKSELTFYYAPFSGEWVACFTVILTEHNRVGGRVAMLHLSFLKNGVQTHYNAFQGGYFQPFGAMKIPCPASGGGSQFDTLKITAVGTDENSHAFSAELVFKYTQIGNRLEII